MIVRMLNTGQEVVVNNELFLLVLSRGACRQYSAILTRDHRIECVSTFTTLVGLDSQPFYGSRYERKNREHSEFNVISERTVGQDGTFDRWVRLTQFATIETIIVGDGPI